MTAKSSAGTHPLDDANTALAWAHADGQAAIEAMRQGSERIKTMSSSSGANRCLTMYVREHAEAYLIAKSVIIGSSVGLPQLEIDELRQRFSERAKELIERELTQVAIDRAARTF